MVTPDLWGQLDPKTQRQIFMAAAREEMRAQVRAYVAEHLPEMFAGRVASVVQAVVGDHETRQAAKRAVDALVRNAVAKMTCTVTLREP